MNANHVTEQRRRFSRVLFNATASLDSGGKTYPCILLDISLKGALIDAEPVAFPDLGTQCSLLLCLDEGETEIRMQGHVAHHENRRLGLRCENIDIDSLTHLRRLVELNVGDESILQRELSALTA